MIRPFASGGRVMDHGSGVTYDCPRTRDEGTVATVADRNFGETLRQRRVRHEVSLPQRLSS